MASGKQAGLPGAFRIAAQLYGLRAPLRRDRTGTLAALAAMGYDGIEGVSAELQDPAGLDADRRAAGLDLTGMYLSDPDSLARSDAPLPGVLRALGVRDTVTGWPGRIHADWAACRGDIRRLAERLQALGMRLHYHNHESEFERRAGRPALERLAEDVAPALLSFELDTYFMLKAGEDPCAWIRRLAGRMTRLHLKDMDARDRTVAVFGQGALAARAILEAAAAAGIEWLVLEFHPGLPDPLDMARRCLDGLRAALQSTSLPNAEPACKPPHPTEVP